MCQFWWFSEDKDFEKENIAVFIFEMPPLFWQAARQLF